jgi:hypothetical protein
VKFFIYKVSGEVMAVGPCMVAPSDGATGLEGGYRAPGGPGGR